MSSWAVVATGLIAPGLLRILRTTVIIVNGGRGRFPIHAESPQIRRATQACPRRNRELGVSGIGSRVAPHDSMNDVKRKPLHGTCTESASRQALRHIRMAAHAGRESQTRKCTQQGAVLAASMR